MKFLFSICVLLAFPLSVFSTEVKVLRVKGKKIVVKVVSGNKLKVNKYYKINASGSPQGKSDFNREYGFTIKSEFSNSKFENGPDNETRKIAVEFSKNYKLFEIGIDVGSDADTFGIGPTFSYFFIENKKGNDLIPFVALQYEYSSNQKDSISYSGFKGSFGLKWFPAGQDYWGVSASLKSRFLSSYKIRDVETDFTGNGLYLGIVNYF